MEKEDYMYWVGIVLMILILIISLFFIVSDYQKQKEIDNWKIILDEKIKVINELNKTNNPKPILLEEILKKEIVQREDWKCLDYATYYNATLSEKYPLLDIRFPRYIDVCNDLTMCYSYHTFIVVAGYGGECILDQRDLACIDILKSNKTQEEIDGNV